MKYIKLFMLATLAVAFASCSDDESWNSNADVTVAMQQDAMKVSEAKGIFNVPIAVTGERNANIKVTVEVSSASTNGAVEDENYVVTQKTCVISPDQTTGNIEIKTVDDDDINENRLFTVKIVDVQGATVKGNDVTAITLKDNDAAFYEKLAGTWKFATSKGTYTCTMIASSDEEDPDYNNYLYMTGFYGYAWTVMVFKYNFDMDTKKITLDLLLGDDSPEYFAEDVDFGLGGANNVMLAEQVGKNIYFGGSLTGEVSDDLKTVTFDPSATIAGAILDQATGDFTGYVWFSSMNNLSMTR